MEARPRKQLAAAKETRARKLKVVTGAFSSSRQSRKQKEDEIVSARCPSKGNPREGTYQEQRRNSDFCKKIRMQLIRTKGNGKCVASCACTYVTPSASRNIMMQCMHIEVAIC